MKKRLFALTALILTLALLLSGCELWELLGAHQYEFDNLPYTRPDVTALELAGEECIHSAAEETKLKPLVNKINDFLILYSDFYTQHTLAYLHYCIDTSDSYWSREYDYCMGKAPTVDAAREKVMYALAKSPLREELEAEDYFGADYFDEYDGQSIWTDAFTALMKEEAALINRYYTLSSPAPDIIPGTESYYEACGKELEALFAELVLLRQKIATEAGFDSYPEFAYDYYFNRDFTPEDAAAFTSGIRQELVPLYTSLSENGGWNIAVHSTTEELTFTYVRKMADKMGGVVEDAFSAMRRHGLYHISYGQNKYPSSFEVYLYDYNLPFVFVNPTQTTSDHLTFAHEFGHFCNDYASGGTVVSIDTAEVFSQGMEYLSLCYAEGTQELYPLKMADSLSVFVEQSAYADFEQQVYGLKEVNADTVRDLFARIGRSYGFDTWDFDARCYTMMPHFYIQPMYLISYVVSNDAAMQLYELELQTPGSGLQVYMDSLDTEQEQFLGFLEEAGLESPFLPDRAAQLRKTLENALKDVPPGTS